MSKQDKGTGLVDALRQAIEDSGMTHYAISKATGISQGVISRFVAGERDLRLETAGKIAEALDMELVKKK